MLRDEKFERSAPLLAEADEIRVAQPLILEDDDATPVQQVDQRTERGSAHVACEVEAGDDRADRRRHVRCGGGHGLLSRLDDLA